MVQLFHIPALPKPGVTVGSLPLRNTLIALPVSRNTPDHAALGELFHQLGHRAKDFVDLKRFADRHPFPNSIGNNIVGMNSTVPLVDQHNDRYAILHSPTDFTELIKAASSFLGENYLTYTDLDPQTLFLKSGYYYATPGDVVQAARLAQRLVSAVGRVSHERARGMYTADLSDPLPAFSVFVDTLEEKKAMDLVFDRSGLFAKSLDEYLSETFAGSDDVRSLPA